jgi:hypothetical protein
MDETKPDSARDTPSFSIIARIVTGSVALEEAVA